MAKDTTRLESSDRRDAAQKSLGYIGLSALAHVGVLITVLLAPSLKTVSGLPTGAQAGEELSYAGTTVADPAALGTEASASAPTEVLLADANDVNAVALPAEVAQTKPVATALAPEPVAESVPVPKPAPERVKKSVAAPAVETVAVSDVAVETPDESAPAELDPPQMDEADETQSEAPVATPSAATEEPAVEEKTEVAAEAPVEAEPASTASSPAPAVSAEASETPAKPEAEAASAPASASASTAEAATGTGAGSAVEGTGRAQMTAPAATGAGTLGASGGGGAKGVYGVPNGAEIRDARELSALPGNPKPTYPLQDKLSGKQGTTVLVGLVKADGSVSNVVVEQSSGSKSMDQSAAQAFLRWRYQPGQSGYIRSPFQFQLAGSAKEIPARLRTQ